MKSQKHITVFISSPSDVSKERAEVLDAIKDVNQIKGDALGYNLIPLTWERDVVPTIGGSPQEVIDASIGDDYDIFLGIMSTRFGTATKDAASGTEHEFQRAYKRKSEDQDSLEIMFYFQEPGHSGRDIDPAELMKVLDFQSSISDKGLYSNYKSVAEFKTQMRTHLAKLMDKVIEKGENQNLSKPPIVHTNNDVVENGALSDPLAILNNLEDDEEIGYYELSEDVADSFGAATENLGALSNAMVKLSTETSGHTQKFKVNGQAVTPQNAKSLLKESSRSMDNFVETSSVLLPLFHRNLEDGLQYSRELLIMLTEDGATSNEDKAGLSDSLKEMNSGMAKGLAAFEGLSETLGSLPRATSVFNRSRKRSKAVIDGLCNLIASAIKDVEDIRNVVEQNQ
jgi:hypothetical protein